MEKRPRIRYVYFGGCGNCPRGQEYRPRLNPDYFTDVQQFVNVAIALIARHNSVKHPEQCIRTRGIL